MAGTFLLTRQKFKENAKKSKVGNNLKMAAAQAVPVPPPLPIVPLPFPPIILAFNSFIHYSLIIASNHYYQIMFIV